MDPLDPRHASMRSDFRARSALHALHRDYPSYLAVNVSVLATTCSRALHLESADNSLPPELVGYCVRAIFPFIPSSVPVRRRPTMVRLPLPCQERLLTSQQRN